MPGVEVFNHPSAYRGHDLGIYEPVLLNGLGAGREPSSSPEQSNHYSQTPDAELDNSYAAPYLDPRVDSPSRPTQRALKTQIDPNVNGTTRHSSLKAHKPLPKRRFQSESPETLRSIFHMDEHLAASLLNGQIRHTSLHESQGDVPEASQREVHEEAPVNPSQDLKRADSGVLRSGTLLHTPHTPTLLPTPPDLSHESQDYAFEDSSNAETAILRSALVTPVTQQSPPTPDNTPPRLATHHYNRSRPFLGAQPSMASTRAESFRTAHENLSDEELSQVSAALGTPMAPPRQVAAQIFVEPRKFSPSPMAEMDKHMDAESDERIEDTRSPLLSQTESEQCAEGKMKVSEALAEGRDPLESTGTESRSWQREAEEPSLIHHNVVYETFEGDNDDEQQNGMSENPQSNGSSLLDKASRDEHEDEQFKHNLQMRSLEQLLQINGAGATSVLPASTVVPRQSEALADADSLTAIDPELVPSTRHQVQDPVRDHSTSPSLTRGPSLRDRVNATRELAPSTSTEEFADDIGWTQDSLPISNEGYGATDVDEMLPADTPDIDSQIENPPVEMTPELSLEPRLRNIQAEHRERVNTWRLSGVSMTSTVEAFVVDTQPQRRQTLKHRARNPSLRSASSPIPQPYTYSNRNSMQSNTESPHRLAHKKARLSNQNRWSFGSEHSRSLSMSSSIAPQPKPELEVIRVAVIPERSSSLKSTTSSKRQSAFSSNSSAHPPSSYRDAQGNSLDSQRQHRRTVSDSSARRTSLDRGRDVQLPPAVPARTSSLSAPTSRSNSRANSITSEHLRLRRVAAEQDVRNTLARMESERVVPLAQEHSASTNHGAAQAVDSEADQWASLRPLSAQQTPFSQPSLQSMSPGPFETGEAQTVNFFPHNNHSLQIIESNPQPESRAVQHLHGQDLQPSLDSSMPPTFLPGISVDSPLRHPRDPPQPPNFKVIPPTPANATPSAEAEHNVGRSNSSRSRKRFGSLKRPNMNRPRSESFVRSLGRSFSLNAKNRKQDQDLDSSLHPFWRPRGFWDEFTDSEDDAVEQEQDRDLGVHNTLGMPQKRVVIDGPISLVRKISDSRKQRQQARGITKQSSYGSFTKLRAGRRIHSLPGLGRFQILGIREMQQRVTSVKNRREDEKRERRRRELRQSIGPNVVSQGDSRFPATWQQQQQQRGNQVQEEGEEDQQQSWMHNLEAAH